MPRPTEPRRPYDAVLCDIDGVLRRWPDADDIERAHGLPPGALASTAFAPARLDPATTGLVTDEQWRSAVADDLAASCGSPERARAAVSAWSALVPVVNDDVVALLTMARRTVPVALVSNATTRLESDLRRHRLTDLADAVINSARVGVAKPDRRIYLVAAQRVGVPADRCLFVDDTAANVVAARELGMIAVHYRGIDDLRAALVPAGSTGDRDGL
ncbi:MAG TPA: HAD family phosphatase [Pseudonocardiaceae bacterium]|nr:HAD family phosphatase [Pseudonocardiaceae bacterium]